MEYSLEVLSKQKDIVACFVQHLAYARGVRAAMEVFTEYSQFWEATASAHLGQALVEWCKVFGSYGEKTHWTKIFVGDAGKQAIEEFCRGIPTKTDLTKPEWKAYYKKMRSLRDTFVAHHDLSKAFSEPIQSFDAALQVAYSYQEWVTPLLREALLEQSLPAVWAEPPYSFISQYTIWKDEAFSIASLQQDDHA